MSDDDAPAPDEGKPGIDHRHERIRVETERHRIEGVMTLARDGYRSRVSDVLNASERDFITLTDVTVAPLEGGPIELHAVPEPRPPAHRLRGRRGRTGRVAPRPAAVGPDHAPGGERGPEHSERRGRDSNPRWSLTPILA